MLRAALCVLLFAVSGFARHDRITELPSGSYLGEGYLVTTAGAESFYATIATIDTDELNLAIVREGQLFSYNLYFDFDHQGFFTVEATETKNGEELTHYGQGYCASVQCHFSFELDDRIIEETLTFASWESKIYTIGSMRYHDENGDAQTLSWEERFLLISANNAAHR